MRTDGTELAVIAEDTGAAAPTYTDDTGGAGDGLRVPGEGRQRRGRERAIRPSQRHHPSQPHPPAAPTGLLSAASHNSVLLLWDDPGDDTITGYRLLRRGAYGRDRAGGA